MEKLGNRVHASIVSAWCLPYDELSMPAVVEPPAISLKIIIAPGVGAVRKFWRPFVLLQAMALGLVISYYTNAHVRTLCETLSDLKQRGGYLFSAIATAIAGAFFPEIAKALVMGDRTITRRRLNDAAFTFFAFAINGVMTDAQYRGLGWLFGHDSHVGTIIKKSLTDQFITTPGYSAPYWVLVYRFRAYRYKLVPTLAEISPRWYLMRVLPLLIPAWCYWLPMVFLIYALPAPLQFCLFCFAVAAWSLLMVFVAGQQTLD